MMMVSMDVTPPLEGVIVVHLPPCLLHSIYCFSCWFCSLSSLCVPHVLRNSLSYWSVWLSCHNLALVADALSPSSLVDAWLMLDSLVGDLLSMLICSPLWHILCCRVRIGLSPCGCFASKVNLVFFGGCFCHRYC